MKDVGVKIGVVALILFLLRKKGGTSIVVDEPVDAASPDADGLAIIRNGAQIFNLQRAKVGIQASGKSVNWDYFNTNELPLWAKVRDKAGNYYYVAAGDFKISY